MKTVELLPKKRRLGRCDQCGETQGVREYLLPYSASGIRGHRGRYRDLCQGCQRRIEGEGGLYVAPTTELAVYGSARRSALVS